MALLGLLGARVTGAGHADAVTAAADAGRAILEARADQAIAESMFDQATRAAGVPVAGVPVAGVPVAGVPVAGVIVAGVTVEDEAGRLNVNTSPTGLIAALLLQLGQPADIAQTLAARISDWRTPSTLSQPFGAKLPAYRAAGLDYGPADAPFRSTGELALVLGMTPAILSSLLPHVTIFTEGDIDRALADVAVRGALVRFSGNVTPAGLSIPPTARVLRLTATEAGRDARFSRVAVVRFSLAANRDDPLVTILDWR
jgi:general secretion pathway protein K